METNMINVTVALLMTILPVIAVFRQKEEGTNIKKGIIFSGLWGVAAFAITAGILRISEIHIVLPTLIPTCLIFAILNFLIMTGKCNINKIPKTLIAIVAFFCASLLQLIPVILFNISIKEMSATTEAILTIYSDICLLLFLIVLYYKDLKTEFIKFKKKFNEHMDIAMKYWILGLVIMMISNLAINFFSPKSIAGNEDAIRDLIKAAPYLTWIATSLLAPAIEELVFRKAFKDVFKTKWVFIIASGMIFGSLHVILSLQSIYDLLYLIPYCSLGISFAYIYQKTETIFAPIAIHTLHNAIVTGITMLTAMVTL